MSNADILALQIGAVPFRVYPSSGIEHPQLEDSLAPVLVNLLLLCENTLYYNQLIEQRVHCSS